MKMAVKMVGHFLALSFYIIICNEASSSSAKIYGVEFDVKLKEIMDETLGHGEFQELIDSVATFNVIIPDGSTTIKMVTEKLGQRFNQYNKAVTTLRDVIEKNLGNISVTRPVECCKTNATLQFNSKYNTYVDRQNICFSSPRPSERKVMWDWNGFLRTVRANERTLQNIGWQYFGTEEGHHFSYPQRRRTKCNEYDPRMRPFYAEASAPVPKDIVIIVDYTENSSSIIEAIDTLLNTTNPNDRIGMVTVPRTTSMQGCYSKSLAFATPANYPHFRSLLLNINTTDRVDHSGSYIGAFGKAFDYFKDTESGESRRKLILFITDKSHSDSAQPEEILDFVEERNKAHNNSVVINTYAFGKGVNADTKTILKPIAERTVFKSFKNATKRGKFTEVKEENYNATRSELGSYYNAFADSGRVTSPIVTVPYIDFAGLGLVISLCLPVHDKEDALKGVTCIDAKIADIFQNVTNFSNNKNSYAFLMDKNGRTVIHPLLPKPSEVEHKPIFMDITALETEGEVLAVIDSMKSGGKGSKSFLASRLSLASLNTGGWNPYQRLLVNYFWHPVPFSDYSLCLVMATGDVETELMKMDMTLKAKDTHHEYQSCLHGGIPVTAGQAQVVNAGNAHRRDQFNMELLMESVVALWQNRKEHDPYIYWRYLVAMSGVVQIYPGTNFSIKPFTENWYTRALEEDGKIILTKITSPQGNSLMLSSALHTGKSSKHSNLPVGVMAGEYRPEYFYQLLLDTFPACNQGNARCFIIDGLGYIIVHPETLSSTSKDHIVHREPKIAAFLKSNHYLTGMNCSDYETLKARHYWKISMDHRSYIQSDSLSFELHPLHYSNIFVAFAWVGKEEDQEKHPTQSSLYPRDFWQCSSTETCNCPCETKLEFNYCDNAPDNLTRETMPNCPIDTGNHPLLHKMSDREYNISMTPMCFYCSNITSNRKCTQAIGCDWCYPENDAKISSLQCLPTHECSYTPRESLDHSSRNKISIPIIVVLIIVIIIICVIIFIRKRHQTLKKTEGKIPNLNDGLTRDTAKNNGAENLGFADDINREIYYVNDAPHGDVAVNQRLPAPLPVDETQGLDGYAHVYGTMIHHNRSQIKQVSLAEESADARPEENYTELNEDQRLEGYSDIYGTMRHQGQEETNEIYTEHDSDF